MTFKRFILVMIASIVFSAMYMVIGHSVAAQDGMGIVGTRLDTMIPFVPLTVWPYLGLYAIALPVGMFMLLTAPEEIFKRGSLGILITALLNFAVFIILPMNYPRPIMQDGMALYSLSPIWEVGWDTWSSQMLWVVHMVDPTSCTLPSFHVTYPMCFVLIGLKMKHQLSWPMIVATLIILITTWTTKQHFIADGFAAMLTSWVGYRIAFNGS